MRVCGLCHRTRITGRGCSPGPDADRHWSWCLVFGVEGGGYLYWEGGTNLGGDGRSWMDRPLGEVKMEMEMVGIRSGADHAGAGAGYGVG